jgi:hypothetical protein
MDRILLIGWGNTVGFQVLQRWLWTVLSSGIKRRVVRWKSTDVSREHVAFIFRVEEWAKQETSTKQVPNKAAFLILFFDPDDERDMFLRHVGSLSTYYTEFYSRRHNFSRVILLDS